MSKLTIGITERGDAGLDFTWKEKCLNHEVDGAILITKNLNDKFIDHLMELYNTGFPCMVHCTCTGWGASIVEPNVPEYHKQLAQLVKLISMGFPKNRCILRIDPIFPTDNGIKRFIDVVDHAWNLNLLPGIRVRISVLDEYPHVRERFRRMGYDPIYEGKFYAPSHMMKAVKNACIDLNANYNIQFECCAEPELSSPGTFVHQGCLSNKDMKAMGLPEQNVPLNPQCRSGCMCLSCKKELLTRCKSPCPHRCAYCFWKD